MINENSPAAGSLRAASSTGERLWSLLNVCCTTWGDDAARLDQAIELVGEVGAHLDRAIAGASASASKPPWTSEAAEAYAVEHDVAPSAVPEPLP